MECSTNNHTLPVHAQATEQQVSTTSLQREGRVTINSSAILPPAPLQEDGYITPSSIQTVKVTTQDGVADLSDNTHIRLTLEGLATVLKDEGPLNEVKLPECAKKWETFTWGNSTPPLTDSLLASFIKQMPNIKHLKLLDCPFIKLEEVKLPNTLETLHLERTFIPQERLVTVLNSEATKVKVFYLSVYGPYDLGRASCPDISTLTIINLNKTTDSATRINPVRGPRYTFCNIKQEPTIHTEGYVEFDVPRNF